LLPFFAALLTGCETDQAGNPTIRVEYHVPDVPKKLRDCGPKPKPGKIGSQKDVATYVNRLSAWGETCADDVDQIDDILTEDEQLVRNMNAKNAPK
jgi:hypothetical protein